MAKSARRIILITLPVLKPSNGNGPPAPKNATDEKQLIHGFPDLL